MPRLLGVDIPGDKRIEASLPYIYGMGPSNTKKVLEQANIDPNARAKDLSPEQLNASSTRSTLIKFRLKVTCAVRSKATSSAFRPSIVTVVYATAAVFLSVASVHPPMPALAKDRAKPWAFSATKTPKPAKSNPAFY